MDIFFVDGPLEGFGAVEITELDPSGRARDGNEGRHV